MKRLGLLTFWLQVYLGLTMANIHATYEQKAPAIAIETLKHRPLPRLERLPRIL